MAANRLSQLVTEVSGQPTTTNATLSQLVAEVSGSPTLTNAILSQFVIEVSGVAGIPVVQGATFTNTNSFPSGGTVGPAGLPVVQTATFDNTNSFPATGSVSKVVTITGLALIPSVAQVFTPGLMVITPPTLMSAHQEWSGYGQRSMPVSVLNEFDSELLQDRQAMELLMRMVQKDSEQSQHASQGGLGSLGNDALPWDGWMQYCPPKPHINCHKVNLRKNLFEKGKLLTPADGGAADHVVVEFWVPTGYSCSLLAYYTIYTGTGFVQGSGDIVWRMRVGNAWARNMGYLPYAMGSSSGTVTLGTAIELDSDDHIQLLVNVPNSSGLIQVGASYILCGVQGWLYPNSSWEQRYARR